MWMVFWQEYLYRRPPDERARLKRALWDAKERENLNGADVQVVRKSAKRVVELYGETDDGRARYEADFKFADALALPGDEAVGAKE